jgi:hypothetical protein
MSEAQADEPDGRPPLERAEELVDEWSRRLGGWLARTAARTREEAEDVWAEAQSLRRGKSDT